MSAKKAFLISPRDMFEKMKVEFNDFKGDSKSTRHAVNVVLTAHHLKEWIWKSYLKDDENLRTQISPLVQDKKTYYAYLSTECEEIKFIHKLANNIKHFYSSQKNEIQETSYGNKTWDEMTCTWDNCHIPWGYEGVNINYKG